MRARCAHGSGNTPIVYHVWFACAAGLLAVGGPIWPNSLGFREIPAHGGSQCDWLRVNRFGRCIDPGKCFGP